MQGYNQEITLWRANGEDEFASPIFNAPEVFMGRWEDRVDQIRTPSGDEITSKAMVWLDEPFEIGDYLALGNFDVVTPSMALAFEVRAKIVIPDIRNVCEETRAVL